MKNLKFSYQKSKKHTLNINHFSINKNSIIGIAGTTGSGKSTLVDILMKITEPKSGKILIDGKVLEKEDFQNWMNKFAMVPQAPHFSNQSILENIAFGSNKSEIDLSKAKQAIKISNLSKKINSLKDGIYTKIGDKGLKLSGGERQRLALARALYFDKEIIVLDEATSSVDSKTEKEIIKSILSLKKNKTLILIAHRINTLKICDTIYLLKEGKITNRGSFKKLLSSSKYFKELNG